MCGSIRSSGHLPKQTLGRSFLNKTSGMITFRAAIEEMKSFYDSSDQYFAYFSPTSHESVESALANLSKFLDLEGPYDGVLAFSHGASFISTYIIQQLLAHPAAPLPFKCAVFFSATSPIDPRVLDMHQEVKALRGPENDLRLINIPTAHIWDTDDSVSLGASQELWNLCEDDKRWRFLHGEGHEIPNSRDREAVFEITKVIRRAVEMGLSVG
ncbi:hypothetical protein BCON_0015g00110 [Botryotinia convoluta]|uniref:Serine hydrolase domain-containing protein n=1 Tax=Botryotinia convoluta TaxID=54673 RepID=A0A4Z1J1N9_9HELO|nr:hypothetical protein BCON_0015g00110 [Botryotinia convoluta]